MPNWCYNVITFKSNEDMLKAFKDFKPEITATNVFELPEFSFDLIAPAPKTKEECVEKYGVEYLDYGSNCLINMEFSQDEWLNWWKWRSEFWGTKWDCKEVIQEGNSIYFECPWNPPVPIFETMSKKTSVSFMVSYAEEQGAVICGHFYSNWDDKYPNGLREDEAYSDEAYETYNEVVGKTFYKLEDGNYHGEWEDCVFIDENRHLHFFDTENPDLEKAKELHKEYGRCFDNFLISNLEETDPAFLKASIGFVRLILNFDEERSDDYVVDFKEWR